MAQEQQGPNVLRLALGAGILAAAALGVAVFVPRRRWLAMAAPLKNLSTAAPLAAMAAWATGLWSELTAPTPPVFDDLRPFDEF